MATDPGKPKKPEKRARGGMRGVDVGADGIKLFTRHQAAGFLRVGLSTLRSWHVSGRLPADRVVEGVHLYTRGSLEQFGRTIRGGNGALAAEVFRRLEDGRTPVAIVIELSADPIEVERLVGSYQTLTGGWLIQGPKGPRRDWEESYRIGELTPAKLRRALELCASDEQLRAKLLSE